MSKDNGWGPEGPFEITSDGSEKDWRVKEVIHDINPETGQPRSTAIFTTKPVEEDDE